MKRVFKILGFMLLMGLLTVVSQVGGFIYMIWFVTARPLIRKRVTRRRPLFFVLSYVFMHWLIVWLVVPPVASLYGRVPLPYQNDHIRVANPVYWICCRNYVAEGVPESLFEIIDDTRKSLDNESIQLVYLDACFPLFESYPVLPHLSHDTGKQLDLAFCYNDTESDEYLPGKIPNYLGYGMIEHPLEGETNQLDVCTAGGYWCYGLIDNVTVWWDGGLTFDNETTAAVCRELVNSEDVRRIFIEPHLKQRWGLGNKVRYHGCHSVRHDDHIHVDFR